MASLKRSKTFNSKSDCIGGKDIISFEDLDDLDENDNSDKIIKLPLGDVIYCTTASSILQQLAYSHNHPVSLTTPLDLEDIKKQFREIGDDKLYNDLLTVLARGIEEKKREIIDEYESGLTNDFFESESSQYDRGRHDIGSSDIRYDGERRISEIDSIKSNILSEMRTFFYYTNIFPLYLFPRSHPNQINIKLENIQSISIVNQDLDDPLEEVKTIDELKTYIRNSMFTELQIYIYFSYEKNGRSNIDGNRITITDNDINEINTSTSNFNRIAESLNRKLRRLYHFKNRGLMRIGRDDFVLEITITIYQNYV